MQRLNLVVFGASGHAGQAFLSEAVAHGHNVRAFVRPSSAWIPHPQVEVHQGRLDVPVALDAAVVGMDGVCCFLGPRPPSTDIFCASATEAILGAMARHRVHRLACVTGAMVAPSDTQVSLPARLMSRAFSLARAGVAKDRAQQESIIRDSSAAWTLFKPPRLYSGPRTSNVAIGPQVRVGLTSSLSYSDLAVAVLNALETEQFVRESVYAKSGA